MLRRIDEPNLAGVITGFDVVVPDPADREAVDTIIFDELPFYGEDEHETMTEDERVEMYQAWSEYRENLRTGTKPDE